MNSDLNGQSRTGTGALSTERVLSGLLLAGVGIGCAFVLQRFASAILWAAILVFTTWPVFIWLQTRLRLARGWAAGLMVLRVAGRLLLPLAAAVPSGADDVAHIRREVEALLDNGPPSAPDWLRGLPLVGATLAEYWNGFVADFSGLGDLLRPYLGAILENGLTVLLGVAGGVLQFLLALFFAYFFWASGDVLAVQLRAILVRIAGDAADRLITVTGLVVRGTVYGILGTALVQGVLTGIGLYVTGVPRPVLLGAFAGLISVLPVGAPVVWIPASLWLLSEGRTGWGIFLAIYGAVLISGSDNIIRPYFIARGARLPFLLTIVGVLGGALAFGLLGIFVGPVLLGVGYILVAEYARGGGAPDVTPALGDGTQGAAGRGGAKSDALLPTEPARLAERTEVL